MTPKYAAAWKHVETAVTKLTQGLDAIPGVMSVHAQYTEPIAVAVVLVLTEDAKKAMRRLERHLFDENPDLPLDLHVHAVHEEDLHVRQQSLETAYGRVWSRD